MCTTVSVSYCRMFVLRGLEYVNYSMVILLLAKLFRLQCCTSRTIDPSERNDRGDQMEDGEEKCEI
jgi:hypothetical protein